MENESKYAEFNKFQQAFFQDIDKFSDYTNFECKKFGYILINNLAKGFPALANIITNIKGLNWSGVQSPDLLKALQHNFVNPYVRARIPNFIYYKNLKPEKETAKARVSKKNNKLLDFDMDIRTQICSILMYDSKTYEYLKYSEKVQFLGKQILGEIIQAQNQKSKKKCSK